MWTSIVLSIIGSGILTTIYTDWRTNRRSRKQVNSAEQNMILAIGRERILVMSKMYQALGEIPVDEYEAYEHLAKAYLQLGGNGAVKKLVEEVMELPITTE